MDLEFVVLFSNDPFNVYRISAAISPFTSDTVDLYFPYFPSQ